MNTCTLAESLLLAAALTNAHAQPVITKQPSNQSVSLGASAKFQVSATSASPPILFHWRLATTNVPNATNSTLTFTNIQIINGGDYDAVLTDNSGSVTSRVAHLEVDPTFTKITAGSIVTDISTAAGCVWGDYNNDGFIDLFITQTANYANNTAQKNLLYQNNGDGTFSRITNSVVTSEARDWRGCAWADYDNDGNLDLFLTSNDEGGFLAQNVLYRNNGDGTFTKMTASTAGEIASAGGRSDGAVWADYDHDGFVDLFVARFGLDWLFHNNRDGTFTKVVNQAVGLLADNNESHSGMWSDYNNDGWADLFVAVHNDNPRNQTNVLYMNRRDGTFTRILTGNIATDSEHSLVGAWGDYDNDGLLDLFVANGLVVTQANSLYHNDGDGRFTKMKSNLAGSIVSDIAQFVAPAWGDYDNDGYVDLFVTKNDGGSNYLYHNNGDGSFTRVLSGSVVNDRGVSYNSSWGDYDNDGFLDLFVPRGGDVMAQGNLLYRNSGNSNNWITVKLIGTASNRSAIGAKVRLKATIGQKTFWQLREIHTGAGWGGNQLDAHFGLGVATKIEALRIEWPSGSVQELFEVAVNQILTVTEPPQLLASVANGAPLFALRGGRGFQYRIEASTNLTVWSAISTVTITNVSGTVEVVDPSAASSNRRYYRAVQTGP